MAKNNVKGVTIEFGGNTQKLETAIKNVNKVSRELHAQIKEVDKALKYDPKNVTLIEQKHKLLESQVKASSDRVKEFEEMQKQLKEQGISESSEEWTRLVTEISKAKGQLEDVKEAQAKFNYETSLLGKAATGFEKLGGGLTAAGEKLSGLSTVAAGALAGLGGLAVKSASVADELITNSKITHLTTEELQRLTYATDLLDVSQETIFGSLKKLTMQMGNAAEGGKTQKVMFKKLGVSIYDTNGKLKTSKQVFDEAIDSLGKIENTAERDALAMDLFGKSAADLNPLIEQGSNAINELSKNAVNVIPDETIQKMGEFDDVMQEMKAAANAAMVEFGGQIAQDLLPIIKELAGFIKGIAKAFGDLSPGVRKAILVFLLVVSAIAPLLIMFGKLSFAISNIIAILPKIAPILKSIAGFFSLPVLAITALIAAFVYAMSTSEDFRKKVFELFGSIKTILENVGMFISNVFTGNWKGAFENIQNIVSSYFSIFPQLINIGLELVKTVVGDFLGFIGNKFGVDLKTPFNNAISVVQEFVTGISNKFGEIISFITDVFSVGWQSIWEGIGGVVTDVFNGIVNVVKGTINSVIEFINGFIEGANSIKLPKVLGGGGVNIPLIPKLAIGTDRVLEDGLAYLHKGEAVVPSKVVEGGYTGGNSNDLIAAIKNGNWVLEAHIDMDGREIATRNSYISGIELKKQGV